MKFRELNRCETCGVRISAKRTHCYRCISESLDKQDK